MKIHHDADEAPRINIRSDVVNNKPAARDLARGIPFLRGYSEIKPIYEGYSGDQKYLVAKGNQRFLLRTFAASLYHAKEREFAALAMMKEAQVQSSHPLEMGRIQDESLGYMLVTFIEGTDGGKALPLMSSKDQYRVGIEAGQELRKINSVSAPIGTSPWYDRKAAKHERYLKQYRDGDTRFRNDNKFLEFIERHLPLMKDRPNRFQHDDFHARNLIFQDRSLSGVIDFNRCDWGDPYHEFLKVGQFSSEVSVPFSIGQIRGYFDEKDPDEEFWRLYSLYIAIALISGVVWTKHVCPEETPDMMRKMERVLDDHDYFECIQPKWYAVN